MKYTIETINSFFVIGFEFRTNLGAGYKEIPKFWDKFYIDNIAMRIPNKINPEVLYGIYGNYNLPDYSLTIGIEVSSIDNVPPNLIGLEIPSAAYVLIKQKGLISEVVPKMWKWVWSDDFPYERRFAYDFERYTFIDDNKKQAEVEIFVGVR